VIVEGEALLPILVPHDDEQLVVLAVRQTMQFVQADEELRVEGPETGLVVLPIPVEVLAAIVPVGDHHPASSPHLLVAAGEEGLHIRSDPDPHLAVLFVVAIPRRVVGGRGQGQGKGLHTSWQWAESENGERGILLNNYNNLIIEHLIERQILSCLKSLIRFY